MHKQFATGASQPVGSERVFCWWDYAIFIPLTAWNLVVISSFTAYWLSLEDWRVNPVPIGLVTILLVYNLSLHQLRWFSLLLMRRPKPMQARQGWKVGVVTTFVPGVESFEMLAETLRALVAMEYPHDTWVLDEGDDRRVKALCIQVGARYFSRKHLSHYQTERGIFRSRTKHGNYNAWLYEVGFAQYEIITSFDPDHVPDSAYLVNVLGYFADPTIGYVQAPQVYYNQNASFIARGAAEETYEYYSASQMASYAMGFPIVTGCHTTHRVTALRQVAGFAPHDADDLLLTYLYRASGWKGVYVPKILAQGLTPVNWSAYLTQQLRWARSVLDIKFRVWPKLMGRLSLSARVQRYARAILFAGTHDVSRRPSARLHAFDRLDSPVRLFRNTLKVVGSVRRHAAFCFLQAAVFLRWPDRKGLALEGRTASACEVALPRSGTDGRHFRS
jgi:hypothetical protein